MASWGMRDKKKSTKTFNKDEYAEPTLKKENEERKYNIDERTIKYIIESGRFKEIRSETYRTKEGRSETFTTKERRSQTITSECSNDEGRSYKK